MGFFFRETQGEIIKKSFSYNPQHTHTIYIATSVPTFSFLKNSFDVNISATSRMAKNNHVSFL
jgi:hypothetical protein